MPAVMRADPAWRTAAYRYSLYLGDLVQGDVPLIQRDIRTRKHIDQLLTAVESISANITEGYGRSTGRDRAKYFEYALSSAREARDWLFKVRHALDRETALARVTLVTRIMSLLLTMIPRERDRRDSRVRRPRRGGTRRGDQRLDAEE